MVVKRIKKAEFLKKSDIDDLGKTTDLHKSSGISNESRTKSRTR